MGKGGGQTFSGLEDKRNALPSGVVDPECGGGESRASRVTRDGLVVEVPRLAVRSYVLPKESVALLDGWDGT